MGRLGTFSACFLTLVAYKFVDPWLTVLRNKMMGWDKEEPEG